MLTVEQVLTAALDLSSSEKFKLIEALSNSIWASPVADDDLATRPLRPYGLAAGTIAVPDDFDAPLPDDILDAFEAG